MIFIFNVESHSVINYKNYIKNYYHIPSYVYQDCFKNEFYENVNKDLNNHNELPIKIYKTKLDNIIMYF